MPTTPKVYRASDSVEFDTPERCAILEVANSAQDPAVSIARARVEPGVTTAWHRLHGTAERYLVVEGEGLVEVGANLREKVAAGDVVAIPPDTAQRITNTGDEPLLFYAICTPRFEPGCYEALDSA
ncbi:cupin domain-containing protein [Salinisphaera sp.]|uniref:cupin domain-containing protein n=1 Tax=Salinisphaera sp. TaxID=1914330 RepID=UPI000C5EA981|nr:cupin domain-containing protein [Salinisphaera sp.]MBS62720.1 cupin [Salinisphaera sp.]